MAKRTLDEHLEGIRSGMARTGGSKRQAPPGHVCEAEQPLSAEAIKLIRAYRAKSDPIVEAIERLQEKNSKLFKQFQMLQAQLSKDLEELVPALVHDCCGYCIDSEAMTYSRFVHPDGTGTETADECGNKLKLRTPEWAREMLAQFERDGDDDKPTSH